MNYSKTQIEDGIIAALDPLHKSQGGTVKKIDGYQGEHDEEKLTQFIIQFPAILVVFLRSEYREDVFPYMIEDMTYSILIHDRNMRGNAEARRGSPEAPGTYSLMKQVRQLIHGKDLSLSIRPCQILREVALVNTKSVSIYSAEYQIIQNIRE